MSKWKPFETAPKDGTRFLTAKRLGKDWAQVVGHYAPDGRFLVTWDHDDEFCPSHWRPLPKPPQPATEKETA